MVKFRRPVVCLLLLAILGGINYVSFRFGQVRGLQEGIVRGLTSGGYVGYLNGILDCPCWDREGSICSICGIKLDRSTLAVCGTE